MHFCTTHRAEPFAAFFSARKQNWAFGWGLLFLLWSPGLWGQILLDENFDQLVGSQPPLGWSINQLQGDPNELWRFDNPGNRPLNAPMGGRAAIFDSDFFGPPTNNPEDVALEMPVLDFSTYSNVFLEFDHWYRQSTGSNGRALVEVRAGVGDPWTVIESFSSTTLNPASVQLDLSNELAGQSNAFIRFRFQGDWDYYWILDNVLVYSRFRKDLQLNRIVAPQTACGLGLEPVQLELYNNGLDTLSNFVVNLQLTGAASSSQVQLVPDTLAPADTLLLTLNDSLDLTALGFYTLNATLSLVNDVDDNPANNSQTLAVENQVVENVFPYTQSWELGLGGWRAGGVNSSWTLSTPNKQVIRGAADGQFAWVTDANNPHNANEQSWLLSPCLDLTSLANPELSMQVWWHCEPGQDGAVVQSSIDDGQTWQAVGASGPILNGYTGTVAAQPAGQNEGWTNTGGQGSGGWVEMRVPLAGLAGQPDARIRIAFASNGQQQLDGVAVDQLVIREALQPDVELFNLLVPAGDRCQNSGITPRVVLRNRTNDTLSNLRVFLQTNGGVPVELLSNATLQPLSQDTFNLGQRFVFPGAVTFRAWVSQPLDINPANDTAEVVSRVVTAPNPVTPDSFASCFGQDLRLQLAGRSQQTPVWFATPASQSPLSFGEQLQLTNLETDTTLYVRNYYQAAGPSALGPVGPNVGAQQSDRLAQGIRFSASTPLNLQAVLLYVSAPGVVQVVVRDSAGRQLLERKESVPQSGEVQFPLGLNVPAGANYELVLDTANTTAVLTRNLNGVSYPITRDSFLTLNGPVNAPALSYPYFYNWLYSALQCPTAPQAIQAQALPLPPESFARDTVPFCSNVVNDFIPNAPTAVSYLWSNGDTSRILRTNNASTYWLEVTDQYGCSSRDTLFTRIVPAVSASAGPDLVLPCNSIANLLGNGQGGTGMLQYEWQGGPASQQWTVNEPGVYVFRVEDDEGCVARDTVQLLVDPSSNFSLNITADTSICEGFGANLLVQASGAQPPYTYEWVGQGTNAQTLPVSQAGLYVAKVRSADGCVDTASTRVRVVEFPQVDLGPDATVCQGDTLTFNAGNPGRNITWWNNSRSQQITLPLNSPGDTLVFVDVETPEGCVTRDSVRVRVEAPLSYLQFPTTPDTLCQGDTLELIAQGGGQLYNWPGQQGPSTQSAYSYVAQGVGLQQLDASAFTNACRTDIRGSVFVSPRPGVELGPDTVLCVGDTWSVTAQLQPGASIRWSTGNTSATQNINALFPVLDSLLTVEAVNAIGCRAADSVRFQVNDTLSLNLPMGDTFCLGQSRIVTAGVTAALYRWNGSVGDSTFVFTPGAPGSQPLSLEVLAPNGCTSAASTVFEIGEVPDPKLNARDSFCVGDTVRLGVQPGFDVRWNNGATTDTLAVVLNNPVTDSLITVQLTTPLNCLDTATIELTAVPFPSINLPNRDTVCIGDTLLFTAGSGSYQYTWNGQPGDSSFAFVGQAPGANPLVVLASNSTGCTTRDSANISVGAYPDADLGAPQQEICPDGNLTLRPSSAPAGSFYTWSNGSQAAAITLPSSAAPDTISLVVVSPLGCRDSDSVQIFQAFPLENLSTDIVDTVGLNRPFTVSASGGTNHQWSFGSNATPQNLTGANPTETIRYSNGGWKTIVLNVRSGNCVFVLTDSIFVDINVSRPELVGPNHLALYPNPARELAWLETQWPQPRPLTLRVLDAQGRLVWTQSAEPARMHRLSLPLHLWSSGLYVLELDAAGYRQQLKLVKP